MSSPEDHHHRDVLEMFVYRARRIEAHSLVADLDALQVLASPMASPMASPVHEDDAGRQWIEVTLPAEEVMESLASRCRPFVLNKDNVHYEKVLKAAKHFVRQDAELLAGAKREGGEWKTLRRHGSELIGYASRVGSVDGPFGELTTDRELAYRWLYGDLIHADDLRATDHDQLYVSRLARG